MHPGSGCGFFPVPDPGAKMHRIPDPDPQHWLILKVKHMPYLKKKVFFSLEYLTMEMFVIFASTPERYRYLYSTYNYFKKNVLRQSLKSRYAPYIIYTVRQDRYHCIVTNVIA
jgi:hypothetical protein